MLNNGLAGRAAFGGRACVPVLALLLAAVTATAAPPDLPPAARVQPFRNWALVCRTDCVIETVVYAERPRSAALLRVLVSLDAAASQGWRLEVATPLPLYLPDPLLLAVGAEAVRDVPWRTCTATGCRARPVLDAVLLAGLRRERAGSATLTLVDGGRVRLGFSLLGFSAALRALEAEVTARR